MKQKLLGLSLLALTVMFSFVIHGGAQEAKTEATPETKPAMSVEEIKKALEEIKNFLGLSLYLQGGYTFNFRNPDG